MLLQIDQLVVQEVDRLYIRAGKILAEILIGLIHEVDLLLDLDNLLLELSEQDPVVPPLGLQPRRIGGLEPGYDRRGLLRGVAPLEEEQIPQLNEVVFVSDEFAVFLGLLSIVEVLQRAEALEVGSLPELPGYRGLNHPALLKLPELDLVETLVEDPQALVELLGRRR